MKKQSKLVSLAALLFASSTFGFSAREAAAQSVGDWVLARYKGGAYWFPGVIQSIFSDRVVISYDDGEQESVSLTSVRPYNWAIGSRVECNFKGTGQWYPGAISSLSGEALSVAYDDGDRETIKTGRCRSK